MTEGASNDYQVQNDDDDVVVEYAASPDTAGCGCLGCAMFVLGLITVLIVALN